MRFVLRAARPLAAALLSSPCQSSRRASVCLLQPFIQPRWPGTAWFRGASSVRRPSSVASSLHADCARLFSGR